MASPPDATTPARPKRLTGEQRRERFLDVASELIAERGLAAVTMERVCERSEVNRALVYRYFANRDELLTALVTRETERFDAVVAARLDGATTTEERLRAMIGAYVDEVQLGHLVISRMLASAQDVGPVFTAWRDVRLIGGMQFLAETILIDFNLSLPRRITAAAILGAAIEGVLGLTQTGADRDHLVDDFVDLCLGGLARMTEREQQA
jgi:AcrR family transcriptional regulator